MDNQEFTPMDITELVKCSEDPTYFIENYCKIEHPVNGPQLLPMPNQGHQRKMIQSYHKNLKTIVLAPRQMLTTSTTCAYILWHAIFKPNQFILITSNAKINAGESIQRIRFMYNNLPTWLKVPLGLSSLRDTIEFMNGSVISSAAVSATTGRGRTVSLLYCDNFGNLTQNTAEPFWASIYPSIASFSKIIISSGACEQHKLYSHLWHDALDGLNEFQPIKIEWDEWPSRDEIFKDMQIKNIGIDAWRREYECIFN